jgi:hypothetical protein
MKMLCRLLRLPEPAALAMWLACLAASCAGPDLSRFVRADGSPQVMTHVRVIDGTGSPGKDDQTIVIQNGRITAVGDGKQVQIPPVLSWMLRVRDVSLWFPVFSRFMCASQTCRLPCPPCEGIRGIKGDQRQSGGHRTGASQSCNRRSADAAVDWAPKRKIDGARQVSIPVCPGKPRRPPSSWSPAIRQAAVINWSMTSLFGVSRWPL